MNAPIYDVAMLGPSGVGKTSVLVAIHKELAIQMPETTLQVRPVAPSGAHLHERRTELERMCRYADVTSRGLSGTAASRSIELAVTRQQDPPDNAGHLKVRFTDHPGGWMFSEPANPTAAQKELQERLTAAQVLVVVLDAPALLYRAGSTRAGEYHHEVNRPDQAAQRINDWLNTGERRLVLFVPAKCEKWVSDPATPSEMDTVVRALELGYPEALQHIRRAGAPAALVPVRTIGGLIHDGYKRTPDGMRSRYRGATVEPKYQPHGGGELLRRILTESIDRRVRERGIMEQFRSWFGHHRDLADALKKLPNQSYGPSVELNR